MSKIREYRWGIVVGIAALFLALGLGALRQDARWTMDRAESRDGANSYLKAISDAQAQSVARTGRYAPNLADLRVSADPDTRGVLQTSWRDGYRAEMVTSSDGSSVLIRVYGGGRIYAAENPTDTSNSDGGAGAEAPGTGGASDEQPLSAR